MTIPGLALAVLLASAAQVNPVTLVNGSASKTNTAGGLATATVSFNTTRLVTDQDGTTLQTWLAAGYSSSDYQIKASYTGSAPTGDSTGVWLSLSSNRSWSVSQNSGAAGDVASTLTIEIRDAAAPNTVRATATFTITANSEYPAPNWDNIFASGTTFTISGTNAAQTMNVDGTLNFAYDGMGASWAIFKNGANQGTDIASLAVVIGDTVYMRAQAGMAAGESVSDGVTVSGAASDYITATLIRDA